jgi:hypothetical protein
MRELNSTTVSVGTGLLLAATAACIALKSWRGDPLLWVIAAGIFFAGAVLLFAFGWLLPRIFGSRRDERAGMPVDPEPKVESDEGNISRGNREAELKVPPNTLVLGETQSGKPETNAAASEEQEPDDGERAGDELNGC